MDYDAKLRPGRADNRGTVATDTLFLGFGSRVVLDIYPDLSADQVNTRVLTIETKDWKYGPQYLTPVFEFVNHGTELTSGRYDIGKAETITGELSDIRRCGMPPQHR